MSEAPQVTNRENTLPKALDPRRALEGALFPLARRHLVLIARENEAPARLLSFLSSVPDREYPDLPAVLEALRSAGM